MKQEQFFLTLCLHYHFYEMPSSFHQIKTLRFRSEAGKGLFQQ